MLKTPIKIGEEPFLYLQSRRAHSALLDARNRYFRASREYANRLRDATLEKLHGFAAKEGQPSHEFTIGETSLFYQPDLIALIDVSHHQVYCVLSTDIRNLDIQRSATGQIAHGEISSGVGSAALGAATGHLLFGSAGAITGAVIGSSAKRSTTETSVYQHQYTVDVFTRLVEFPVMTIDFGENEPAAKHFFAFMNVGNVAN